MNNFLDIHLNCKLFFSNKIEKKDYHIYYSNYIDDYYYNYAYLINSKIDSFRTFESIITDMGNINRQPFLYVTSDILNPELEQKILENNFKLVYTDSWLELDAANGVLPFKSSLDFTTCEIDKNYKKQFINAVCDGFSGESKDDPYESLSDGYRKCLDNSFNEQDDDYKIIHYIGQKEGKIISTASIVYKNNYAVFYNVTTNKQYQKLGVCRQMMSDIINELKEKGINNFCVSTAKDFYPELIYQKLGFRKAFLGLTYSLEE